MLTHIIAGERSVQATGRQTGGSKASTDRMFRI